MYWGLHSRINWLKWGNKNSKYFHATTIQRRNQNRIFILKSTYNDWIQNENTLTQKIVDCIVNCTLQ